MNHPDLAPILGSYLDDFTGAMPQGKGARRRDTRVEGAKVVVIKGGHMRAVHGKAYLPALLPAEVTADDIK